MQNKITLHECQLNSQIKADLKTFCDTKLYGSDLDLLKQTLIFNTKYAQIYPSQHLLSSITGYSTKTIQRAANRLESFGLIQKWRLSNSYTYILNDFLLQPHIQKWLKRYLGITFAMALLFSYESPDRGGVHSLIYKDDYFIEMTDDCNKNILKRESKDPLLYESQLGFVNPIFRYSGEDPNWVPEWYKPNPKRSIFQFDNLLGESMLPFTQEQLEEIAQYPTQIINIATKNLTRELLMGKSISNQFNYFMAILKKESIKASQKDSSNSAKQFTRPKTGPLSLYKEPEQIIQETDFEFAYNVEKGLHHRLLNEPDFHPAAGKIPNPKLHLLSPEEQIVAMSVHKECSCRAELDPSSLGAQLLAKIGLTVV